MVSLLHLFLEWDAEFRLPCLTRSCFQEGKWAPGRLVEVMMLMGCFISHLKSMCSLQTVLSDQQYYRMFQ